MKTPDSPGIYTIRIAGRLDSSWSDWFEGFTIHRENGETVLVGEVADQAALHGLLGRIARLNLLLLSVSCSRAQGGNGVSE